MRSALLLFTSVLLCFCQESFAATSASDEGLTVELVIQRYAEHEHAQVVVDPRVKGRVALVGESLDKLTFEKFLAILRVSGFTALKDANYTIVIPTVDARDWSADVIESGKKYSPDQYVIDVISLDKICGLYLMTSLRPIISPYGHITPVQEPNSVLVADFYSNVVKARTLAKKLDGLASKRAVCEYPNQEGKPDQPLQPTR